MKKRTIVKRIVSGIFGTMFALFTLAGINVFFRGLNVFTGSSALVLAASASLFLFFILWNIISSKLVYLLLVLPVLGVTTMVLVEEVPRHVQNRARLAAQRSRLAAQRTQPEVPTAEQAVVHHVLVAEDTVPPVRQVPVSRTFFVAPRNGLNLRAAPDTTSAVLRALPRFTPVHTRARTEHRDIVDGIYAYWYEVDSGGTIGWVFGGYVLANLDPRREVVLERAYLSEENRNVTFPNGNVLRWGHTSGSSAEHRMDHIRVYERTCENSEFIELVNTRIFFLKLDETDDWLYAVVNHFGDGERVHGFVYARDINDMGRSGSGLLREEIREYELIQTHGNIDRFGPILMIHHNYELFRFVSFSEAPGRVARNRNLIAYFPEHDEALINKMYWEVDSSEEALFNFRLGTFTAEGLGRRPSFSPSRNHIVTLRQGFHDEENFYYDSSQNTPSLRVFALQGDQYQRIFEAPMGFRNRDIRSIVWENDHTATIHYNETNVLRVRIDGNHVEVYEPPF